MQALITTSRSINHDPFYQRQQDKKLQFHNQKINNITASRAYLNQNSNKINYAKSLKKAKSAAKLFQSEQNKSALKRNNNILLTKLMNVQSTLNLKHKQNSANQKKFSTTATSNNWLLKKNQDSDKLQIQTKKKIKIINQVNVKDMKKKIQDQIKEYLQLKNHIRKFKDQKKTKDEAYSTQKCKSQRKIKPTLQLALPNLSEKTQKDLKSIQNQQQCINKNKKIQQKQINIEFKVV